MKRYGTVLSGIDCIHVDREDGTCLSIACVLDHERPPAEFAEALEAAAAWFHDISDGKILPLPERHRHAGRPMKAGKI